MTRFHYLVSSGNDDRMCLCETDVFRSTPRSKRVVTSTFKMGGRFGDFTMHKDRDALWQMVDATPAAQRNFNTVLFKDEPVRLFLDLEKNSEASADHLLKDVIDVIEETFSEVYPGHALGRENVWYFSATTPTKASFHLHADPDLPHAVWTNVMELGKFMKDHVKRKLEQEWPSERSKRLAVTEDDTRPTHWFIDFSVYTRNRSFKLPLCCKPGKATMTLWQAPSNVPDTSERRQFEVGMPQDHTYTQLLPQLPERSRSMRRTEHHVPARFRNNSREQAIVLEWIKDWVGESARWESFQLDSTERTVYATLAKGTARCSLAGRTHRSNRMWVGIHNGTAMNLSCFSCTSAVHRWQLSDEQQEALFSAHVALVESESESDAMDVDQEIAIENAMRLEQQSSNFGMPLRADNNIYIDQRYLGSSEEEIKSMLFHRRVAVRSPMDTAKSTMFIAYIVWLNKQYAGLRIALVTSRVSLAVSLQKRMVEAGITVTNYLDHAPNLDQAPCVIVQLDSICKLIPRGQHVPLPFDLVLLDEAESTLAHFRAATLKRSADVWDTFKWMCTQATQLMMFDAFLGVRAQDFLDVVVAGHSWSRSTRLEMDLGCDHRPRIIINACKTDKKLYAMHPDVVSFHTELHKQLAMKKRIVVASNRKVKADELYHEVRKKHPDLRVLLYTSESSDQLKMELGECNTHWLQWDVVIYSPTIGAGVDFNPPEPHFDFVFGWAGAGVNPAREFLQMLGRVRKVKSAMVHLHLEGAARISQPLVCDRAYIENEIELNWAVINDLQALDPARRELIAIQRPDGSRQLEARFREPAFVQLYIHNRLEHEQSCAMFGELLQQAILDQGGRIQWLESVDVFEADKQAIKDHSIEQRNQMCQRLAEVVFESNEEMDASRRRREAQEATEHDKLLARKQNLIRTYQLNRVPLIREPGPAALVDLIDRHGDEAHLHKFATFCLVNSSEMEANCVFKAHMQTDRQPLLNSEVEVVRQIRLLRGLLWVVGFEGDICSTQQITTDSLSARLEQADVREWLEENKMGKTSVKECIRLLRAVLKDAVGLEVIKEKRMKRKTIDSDGQTVVTTWSLDSQRRDEMLELAYAGDSSSWEAIIHRIKPAFHWQTLTGLEPPYDPPAQNKKRKRI